MRNIARPSVQLVFSSSAATFVHRNAATMGDGLSPLFIVFTGIAAVGGWLWLLEIGISWLIAKL